MKPRYAVGVDLGGTFVKSAIVDEAGEILHHVERPTRPERGPQEILEALAVQIEDTVTGASIQRSDVIAMGIGSPGPLSRLSGTVFQTANLPGWKNVPIRDVLSRESGLKTVLHNDANVAAYAEFRIGAGALADPMILLTLGTGIGGGIVIQGRLFEGHFENAAELGHMIIEVDGRVCSCGQRGCLEQYASATSVVRRAREALERGDANSRLSSYTRDRLTAEAVVEAMMAGDALAERIWDDTCRWLAIGCINLQHAFNPARIVLGGGMSEAGAVLLDRVRHHHGAAVWHLLDDAPEIVLAKLGNDAGVIGAALLAFDEFG